MGPSHLYKPKQTDEYVSILGFNLVPLPNVLLDALANHPEMIPDETAIVWTIEQELFLQTTIGEIREKNSQGGIMTPERPSWQKPYEVFGITEAEVARWRVTDERLREILANPNTTTHTIKLSTQHLWGILIPNNQSRYRSTAGLYDLLWRRVPRISRTLDQ